MNELKRMRRATGHTQATFCKLIGMSIKTYQQYEQGVRRPKIEAIAKMAKGYKISTFKLLDILERSRHET